VEDDSHGRRDRTQRWRFIVIKDAETKRWIQERYRTTDRPAHAAPRDAGETRTAARNDAAAEYLAEHLHEVPVLILCCVQHDGSPSDIQRGASGFEREIKAKLGIPDNVDTAALLPLGHPAERNRYGPTNRRPVEEVTFDEAWGKPWHA